MHPMSTEEFLREIVFRNNGNSSSSGTLLGGDTLYQVGGEVLSQVGGNKLQHRQFIKNDGGNFGLTGENDGVIPFQDSKDQLEKYNYYDGHKYKAKFIEAARDELEQEWLKELERNKEHNQERTPARMGALFHGMDEGLQSEARYGVVDYNCQDYVDDIVARARKLAERKGEKLEIE